MTKDPGDFAKMRLHQRQAPVDVVALARDLDLPVYTDETLSDNISGMLIRSAEAGGSHGFCIVINAHHHPNRQRFTVAHEIAHYMLHRDIIGEGVQDNRLYRSHLSGRIEAEANRLAADILMPWDLINEAIDRLGLADVDSLARHFRVSPSAMSIRLGVPAD